MKAFKFILDLVYPPRCVFCEAVLKDGDICDECIKNLPYTKGDAIYQKFAFVKKCVSPLFYKDNVRESVLRYKFFGNEANYITYGRLMAECIENNLDCGGVDVISWVPLSRKRMRKRGYNQSELLVKGICGHIELPAKATLRKIKDNPAQSGTKDSKEREKNVSGVYEVTADVEGKYILLVDDVVTTGSTLSECARMLRKAGAAEVYCATLARHED